MKIIRDSYRPYLYVKRMRGDSLIEVMVALWLTGIAILGAMNMQLLNMRIQQSALYRARGIQYLDAVAEALRAGGKASQIAAQWGKQLANLLPAGGIKIVDKNEAVRLITLYWREPMTWRSQFTQPDRDCPLSSDGHVMQCVSVSVAR